MTYRPQDPLRDQTAQEEFLSDLELNIAFIEANCHHLETIDRLLAEDLVEYYVRYDVLTYKQILYATKFWQELNSKGCK